nr:hypothetical protein [uncultured bacterium]
MPKIQEMPSEQYKVNLRVPLDMHSKLAHHINVTDTGDLIQLSFFEVIFPILSDVTTEAEKEAIKSSGLVATCVSKVNIPKEKFSEFVKLLSRFEKRSQK